MQVSVEKTSELSRKMTVCVPEEVVQEKMAARLKSLVFVQVKRLSMLLKKCMGIGFAVKLPVI